MSRKKRKSRRNRLKQRFGLSENHDTGVCAAVMLWFDQKVAVKRLISDPVVAAVLLGPGSSRLMLLSVVLNDPLAFVCCGSVEGKCLSSHLSLLMMTMMRRLMMVEMLDPQSERW